MMRGNGVRVLTILLSLVLVLVPIGFYLHIEREVAALVEVGVDATPWQHRIFLYIEALSLGCFLALTIRSRRAYMIALVLLLCQIGVLIFWYYELMSRRLYPDLLFYSFFYSEEAASTFKDYTENFVQGGATLLLIGLLAWQWSRIGNEAPNSI